MCEIIYNSHYEYLPHNTLQTWPLQPAAHNSIVPNNNRMRGADIIVHTLHDLGVDTIFGYSGGAILPTYDAIFRYNSNYRAHHPDKKDPLNLIVPANEQGAGFMAAGYARASSRPGVFLVTSGPGATNCVTPIRDCMADSVPVLMISGQVATSAIGSDAFQEAPIFNIMSSAAKHVFLVTQAEKLEATIRSAFEIMLNGRPGPVVVDIPKDIQNWEGEYKKECTLPLDGWRKRISVVQSRELDAAACKKFFDFLKKSNRPLLYVGGGVLMANAADSLRAFIERYKIPVVTTLMGISAVDTRHDLCLHMLGMHGTAYANYAVEDCDTLIAIGARFDDRVASDPVEFAPNAKCIMHIDIDGAEIDKVKKTNWSYHGDAKQALQSLLKYGENLKLDLSKWHQHIADLKKEYALNYDRTNDLIQPYYVLEELNKQVKGEAIITTGVGQHQMWAAQYLDYRQPRSWLTSGSMGTMGFGLPAAIGAKFACPDTMVFSVDGDGSLRMNFGELETVTTYQLDIKIILLNNHGDGMVRQWQKLFFKNRFSGTDKSLHKKDFVKAAEADGFKFARRIIHKQDVIPAIKEFVAFQGPAFLEVVIDPDAGVYPMVSPGTSYKSMITGDFIKKRQPMEMPVEEESSSDDPIKSSSMF